MENPWNGNGDGKRKHWCITTLWHKPFSSINKLSIMTALSCQLFVQTGKEHARNLGGGATILGKRAIFWACSSIRAWGEKHSQPPPSANQRHHMNQHCEAERLIQSIAVSMDGENMDVSVFPFLLSLFFLCPITTTCRSIGLQQSFKFYKKTLKSVSGTTSI